MHQILDYLILFVLDLPEIALEEFNWLTRQLLEPQGENHAWEAIVWGSSALALQESHSVVRL